MHSQGHIGTDTLHPTIPLTVFAAAHDSTLLQVLGVLTNCAMRSLAHLFPPVFPSHFTHTHTTDIQQCHPAYP